MTENDILEIIDQDVKNNDVLLYMKGTAQMPQCGFSSVVAQVLKNLEVPFKSIDVLTNPEIREGIKQYSNWPTIPQLYIKGEFIGGCDIVRDMFQSGELKALLQSKNII